jgi:uncharacterized protein (TIGR03435 family)
MRRALLGTALAIFVCSWAFGQAAENLTFEVASVKPAAVPAQGRGGGRRGGPGTPDPGQITWNMPTLRVLLTTAYDVKNYQLIGPAWLDTEHYDIVAKVPVGATKEQVNVMFQNLLKERFGVVVHHESKEFQVDELVLAKGGSKLKETTLDPNAPPAVEAGPPKLDKNGSPEMSGPGMMMTVDAGSNGPVGHMVAKAQPMSVLATMLGNQLSHPVLDKTGLTGKYDFTVEFTPNLPGAAAAAGDASDPGSSLAAAIQRQLGLGLSPGKAKLDVVVVDKAERVPTEN